MKPSAVSRQPSAIWRATAFLPAFNPWRPAAGGWQLGFTLIELLVVVVILAIAAATVALAVPSGDGRLLREEAARLGALFRIAQDEARVSGRALVWEADLQGYRFRPLDPVAARTWSDDILRPRPWPFTVVEIERGAIVFGREPLLDPVTLRIVTPEREARLALDALGNLQLLNGRD